MNKNKLIKKLEKFIGEKEKNKKSVIHPIYNIKFPSELPPLTYLSGRVLIPYKKKRIMAGAVDEDKNIAIIKTVCEAIERYCLYSYNLFKERIIFCNALELEKQHKNFLFFNLFSEKQYSKNKNEIYKMNKKLKIDWIDGFRYGEDSKVYVPASFIFPSYKLKRKGKNIGKLTTSGAACGILEESAMMSSIFELVERDSILFYWYTNKKPTQILIENKYLRNKKLKRMYNLLSKYNIPVKIYFFPHYKNFFTTLSIALMNIKGIKFYAMGSACHQDVEESILHSLGEMTKGFFWYILIKGYKNKNIFLKDFNKLKKFQQRIVFYSTPKMRVHLENFFKNSKKRKISKILSKKEYKNLKVLLMSLKKEGVDIVFADITPNIFKKEDFFVYKAISPQLINLDSEYKYRFFGALENHYLYNTNNLNQLPHPLP